MSTEVRIFSPVDDTPATRVKKHRWRKQILPLGEITYKGKKIRFDKEYLNRVKAAYEDRAFDQVSLQLANDRGEHPTEDQTKLDPSRWRGQVALMEVTDQGLFTELDVTPDMDRLLKKNPKLGVSAAIDQNYARVDGKFYPAAIQHILATIDPRIAGMASWEKVTLANEEADSVVDLTDEEVVQVTTETETPPNMPPSQEQIDAAVELLKGAGYSFDDTDATEDDTDEDSDDDEEYVEVEADPRVDALEVRLARSDFDNAKKEWLDAGVPPAMVDHAEELLTRPESDRIELSRTGHRIDAAEVVRKILEEAKGVVSLGREVGQHELESDPQKREESLLNAWEGMR